MSHNLQPVPWAWGNRQIATSTANRFLNPLFSRSTAQTNRIPWPSGVQDRRVRSMSLTVRQGRGNGSPVTYMFRLNEAPTGLQIIQPSTFTGTMAVIPSSPLIIPAGQFLDVLVTKNMGGIGQSPLDVIVQVDAA